MLTNPKAKQHVQYMYWLFNPHFISCLESKRAYSMLLIKASAILPCQHALLYLCWVKDRWWGSQNIQTSAYLPSMKCFKWRHTSQSMWCSSVNLQKVSHCYFPWSWLQNRCLNCTLKHSLETFNGSICSRVVQYTAVWMCLMSLSFRKALLAKWTEGHCRSW